VTPQPEPRGRRPSKKPVVIQRGPNRADVHIDHDTTPELPEFIQDLHDAIGHGPGKQVHLRGNNLPLNQAVAILIAREAKENGYERTLRLHPQEDRDLIWSLLFEMVDDVQDG
jgi:hypothetical protein